MTRGVMSRRGDADSPRVERDVVEGEFPNRSLLDEVLADDPEEDELLEKVSSQEELSDGDRPRPA
ncbi:hypothetical protein BKH24_12550, partial [Actinomyces oris]